LDKFSRARAGETSAAELPILAGPIHRTRGP